MTTCPACLEPKESWSGTVHSPCGHEMCQKCFITHVRLNPKARCPECRRDFVTAVKQEEVKIQAVQRQHLDNLWASTAERVLAYIKYAGAAAVSSPMEEC